MKNNKLAPGMTVQTAGTGIGNSWRVAYCVRCSWQSEPISYRMAKVLACSDDSHTCLRKTKFNLG